MRELGSAVVSWDKSKILARTPKVMCKTKWDLKPQVMSSVHGSNSADVIHHDLITTAASAAEALSSASSFSSEALSSASASESEALRAETAVKELSISFVTVIVPYGAPPQSETNMRFNLKLQQEQSF